MTPTTFQMRYDPSTQSFLEHPPVILSSASAGEKRISVEVRELATAPRAAERRRQFLIIPIQFAEKTGILGLSASLIEMIKNLSAAIGLPALLLLWVERRQRQKEDAKAKRGKLIFPKRN